MNKKDSTKNQDPFQNYEFAKNFVRHLHSIGQIKKMPTDAEMETYWKGLDQK